METVTDFIFLGSKITMDGGCSHKSKDAPWKESYDKPRQCNQIIHGYGFSHSYVWMWEFDHKEGWVLKNWYFETVVLGRTHESPLDCKEIKPVNPKGNQSWIFIQGLMLKVKCQYFGHLMWRASSVQLLSHVRLFAIPWTTACQASLSITKSWSLPKLMSIQSVMPSNHPILCHPLLLPPSVFPSIRVFSNESVLHVRWPKYWSFNISSTNQY